MGWGLRLLGATLALVGLALGAWPLSLLVFGCLLYSFRHRPQRTALTQEVIQKPKLPWGHLVLGGSLLLLSAMALGAGGTLSPVVFMLAGMGAIASPFVRMNGLAGQVAPMTDSILLRSRVFPFRWHALAEVKLEAQDQTRGVASMDGRLLVFAGKSPTAIQVVTAYAFGHREAEDKVIATLRRETRALSQRGAHLLPLDSVDAHARLSMRLRPLRIGTDDLEAVSSLPFDVFTLHAKEGLIAGHRAFKIDTSGGPASIPPADISPQRRPLFAEFVEEISERHGWPMPDEFSPFLAALDASRADPLADRLRLRGEEHGRVTVDAPGGAEVKLTRAQLRAVARIYG